RLEAENRILRQDGEPEMIAESPAMRPVLELIERVAPSDANVLISGEHGTGKEVVARRIHAMSHRAGKPFVPVNAGALSEGVFESELFGHVKGAFTDAKADRTGCFELGDQGTLFMDEVANMPLGQQAKLLRVLQTGEFHPVGSSRVRRADTRVLAATNADLHAAVKSGAFREDLLYRLNTVEVVLPPLRDRREDIPALASAFLAAQAARYRKPVQRFGVAALKALLEYPWPGNVRELEHCVERAVLMARGAELTPEDLVLRPRDGGARVEDMTLEDAERYLIQRALGRSDGSVSDAAKLLGLSRSALYRRLQQYGLKAS
ncbi:MAG: sigma-54 interaction domain-containing protein, partial [Myxococcaceae bacterium]